jgi:hypothetical protein
MDFTNRYAIMCQKATEIQERWVPKPCDFMIDHADVEGGFGFCSPAASIVQVVDIFIGAPDSDDYKNESEHLKKNSFYLPRQDQLQKIMEPDDSKIHSIINRVVESRYYEPAKGDHVAAPYKFYSMEQIWFAYVMKEKYNKTWNEEEWVIVP